MSNSDLAIANLPQTFRETLREKVMAATLDLIPKEVLDGYISREITAFFESEELLTVKETEVVTRTGKRKSVLSQKRERDRQYDMLAKSVKAMAGDGHHGSILSKIRQRLGSVPNIIGS